MNATGGLAFVAIGIGAALGAWLRYLLSLAMNAILPTLPLGTLVANLGGGFLIGIAVAVFGANADWSPAWRLFAVTGFLGGLTTFSTFSAESMLLLQEGRPGWALTHAAVHLLGALGCCFVGFALARRFIG